jgi:hypothetical protein
MAIKLGKTREIRYQIPDNNGAQVQPFKKYEKEEQQQTENPKPCLSKTLDVRRQM